MWRIVFLLGVAALLAGCWPFDPGSRQIEGQCQLDAAQFEAIHGKDDPDQARTTGYMTELCMQSKGYRIENNACPVSVKTTATTTPEFFIIDLDAQREVGDCYVRDWQY